MTMIVTFIFKDGYELTGHILYHHNYCYYIDAGDSYWVVPWVDVAHSFEPHEYKKPKKGEIKWKAI